MNEQHWQRIDKGLPRRKIRKEAREQARNNKGMFLPAYSPEVRSQAILEAIEGLQTGREYPTKVAERHQIPVSTIYAWLIAEPQANEARAQFFAERLSFYLERIEQAPDPLELARGREGYRAWADLAGKRNPSHYGVKQEITHIQADLGDRLRRARERVIDQVPESKEVITCPNIGVMSNPPENPGSPSEFPKDPTESK